MGLLCFEQCTPCFITFVSSAPLSTTFDTIGHLFARNVWIFMALIALHDWQFVSSEAFFARFWLAMFLRTCRGHFNPSTNDSCGSARAVNRIYWNSEQQLQFYKIIYKCNTWSNFIYVLSIKMVSCERLGPRNDLKNLEGQQKVIGWLYWLPLLL